MANQRICSIPGCGKRYRAKGLCNAHYLRRRDHGDPLATIKPSPVDFRETRAFIEQALSHDSDACLIWRWKTTKKGYAIATIDGRKQRVHRYICERVYGKSPHGKPICCHSCDNPGCINPRHLRWGTPKENSEEMVRRQRSARGENGAHAKLTVADVQGIRRLRGIKSESELAKLYGVTRPTIACIMQKRTWSWLE